MCSSSYSVIVKTCVLRVMTKKVVNFLRKKCIPEFAPLEKNPAAPKLQVGECRIST